MTIAPAATGRSFLESPLTQVRRLEGRPLGMSSALMLAESSRLRLLELRSSFVSASAEQRQPMPSKEGFEERKRAGQFRGAAQVPLQP